MKRRDFLKTCFAGVAVAAVPVLAFSKEVLTLDDIRKAVSALNRNQCKPFGGRYIGFVHPDAAHDLRAILAGSRVGKTRLTGYIGDLEGVDFYHTQTELPQVNPDQNYLNMRGRW